MKRKKQEKVRTFIAVKLSDQVKKELGKVERHLDVKAPGTLRLVKVDQLHITVGFLGKISPQAQETAISVCEQIAEITPAFTVHLSQLGAFPRLNRPAIVWIGLGGEAEKLTILIKTVETRLADQGILPIRGTGKLVPHVTLGRVKRKRRSYQLKPLRDILENTELQLTDLSIPVKELVVYTSNLGRRGPRHVPVATIALTRSTSSAAGQRGS